MSDIYTYVVVDDKGQYIGEEHDTFNQAKNSAIDHGNAAVVELTYEINDSQLIWTPDGSDTW